MLSKINVHDGTSFAVINGKRPVLSAFSLLAVLVFFVQPVLSQTTPIWQKKYGNYAEISKDAVIGTDGTILVVGQSGSDGGEVSGHHGSTGVTDAWVVKLDSMGDLLWQKSIGGTGADLFNMVFATGDTGYICVGSSQSTDGDLAGYGNTPGAWVVKLSCTGSIVWSKTYGGATSNGAVLMDNGNIALIVEGTGSNSSVLQLDRNGNIVWQSPDNSLTGRFITETNEHALLTSTGLLFDATTGDTTRFTGFPGAGVEVSGLKRIHHQLYISVKDSNGNYRVGKFDESTASFLYQTWSNDYVAPDGQSVTYNVAANGLDAFSNGAFIIGGNSIASTRGGVFYYPLLFTLGQEFIQQGGDGYAQFTSIKTFPVGDRMLACVWAWYENRFWIVKYAAGRATARWTGAVDNSWENPHNWDIGSVPYGDVKVWIPGGLSSYPVINGNAACYSLQVDSTATFTVNEGYHLTITGP